MRRSTNINIGRMVLCRSGRIPNRPEPRTVLIFDDGPPVRMPNTYWRLNLTEQPGPSGNLRLP